MSGEFCLSILIENTTKYKLEIKLMCGHYFTSKYPKSSKYKFQLHIKETNFYI